MSVRTNVRTTVRTIHALYGHIDGNRQFYKSAPASIQAVFTAPHLLQIAFP